MALIPLAVFYFILVIVAAHFFAPAEHIWSRNTISELAAQGLPNQWIMQAGFIGFGLVLNAGIVWRMIESRMVRAQDILLMVYGAMILLSGFFSTASFIAGGGSSPRESALHSVFATLAGIAFTLAIFAALLAAPTAGARWTHAVFMLLVIAASAAFGLSENGVLPVGRGVVQRMLYLVSFIWLVLRG